MACRRQGAISTDLGRPFGTSLADVAYSGLKLRERCVWRMARIPGP
jgi:hypothetical protein